MILEFSVYSQKMSFSDSDLIYISNDIVTRCEIIEYKTDEGNTKQKSWWGGYTLCLFGKEAFMVEKHLGHTSIEENFAQPEKLKELIDEHKKIMEALRNK